MILDLKGAAVLLTMATACGFMKLGIPKSKGVGYKYKGVPVSAKAYAPLDRLTYLPVPVKLVSLL